MILVIREFFCLNMVLPISTPWHPGSGHSQRLAHFLSFSRPLVFRGVQAQELAQTLKTPRGLYNGLTQGCVKGGLQK